MSPELRLVAYVLFSVSLFLFPDLTFYSVLFLILALMLCRVDIRRLRAGWVPIGIFLLFTFISNAVNHPGRIVLSAGSLMVTAEGLNLAALRTLRILLMIGGVKLLTAATSNDDLISALARLLQPFEKLRLPVREFFHVMGLTLGCFPRLQEAIRTRYNESVKDNENLGLMDKAKLSALFLMPLFVESIQAPAQFFEETKQDETKV